MIADKPDANKKKPGPPKGTRLGGRPNTGRKRLYYHFDPDAHQYIKDNREKLEAWAKSGKELPNPE